MSKKTKKRKRGARRPRPAIVPNTGVSPLGVSARRDPALVEFGQAVRAFLARGAEFGKRDGEGS